MNGHPGRVPLPTVKALILIVVLLLVCAVLFFTGVVSPRRSKRMQGKVQDAAGKAENRSKEAGGPVRKRTGDAIQKSEQAAKASAEKGRSVNKRLKRR